MSLAVAGVAGPLLGATWEAEAGPPQTVEGDPAGPGAVVGLVPADWEREAGARASLAEAADACLARLWASEPLAAVVLLVWGGLAWE